MADRKQRVVLNGQCSKLDTISAVVPQGSVLGPLLFLIYINDITHNVKCGIKLFADDTSLFTTVQNANVAALDLNRDLDKINYGHGNGKCSLTLTRQRRLYFHAKGISQSNRQILNLEMRSLAQNWNASILALFLTQSKNFKSHILESTQGNCFVEIPFKICIKRGP